MKHTLAPRHGRLQRRVELAEFADRLEEAGDVGKEGHDDTQRQLAPSHGQTAKPQDDTGRQHAQKLDGGHEDEGKGHGGDVGVAVGPVHFLKPLAGGVFLNKGLDDAHACDVLSQVAHDNGDAGSCLAEGHLGAPREEIGGQQHQGKHREGQQGQQGADGEHHTHDAQQYQRVANQRDEAFRQEFVDDGDIADDPRDDDAGDMGVVIAQVQRLEMAEELGAHAGQHPLPRPGEQVPLAHGRGVEAREDRGQEEGDTGQARRVSMGDGLIDGFLEQIGADQGHRGPHEHEEEGRRHALPVGSQVDQEPDKDAPV